MVLVQGEGFEPPKAEPDDLQSPVFDRFTIPALNAILPSYRDEWKLCGADRGIRTHDPLFTKQPLWPLSYVGISGVILAKRSVLDNDALSRTNNTPGLARWHNELVDPLFDHVGLRLHATIQKGLVKERQRFFVLLKLCSFFERLEHKLLVP